MFSEVMSWDDDIDDAVVYQTHGCERDGQTSARKAKQGSH